MSKYNSLGELFAAIANAIRAKTGGTDPIVAEDFPAAVEGISAGGGDIDALIDGSLTEITSNAETVKSYAFIRRENLKTANFPKATVVEPYAFQNCFALESVDFPLLTETGNYMLENCRSLSIVNIPKATQLSLYVFSGCSMLKSVVFPLVADMGAYVFNKCSALESADFSVLPNINMYGFYMCQSLRTLILRSQDVCTLSNKNALDGCNHFAGIQHPTYNPDGLKDGYIYVPRALIEDYKVATNWVTFADQFRALEDYTVDGTTTGELDESKVSL